jgi:hypothetical protein
MSVQDIDRLANAEEYNGKLPAFAWPGGYPMAYVTEGGDTLCADCATAELTSWRVNESDDPPAAWLSFGNDTDYPETDERCDNCGRVICEGTAREGQDGEAER